MEFALLAPAFFGLLMGIFDVGFYFLNKNVMMSAISVAQRIIQTGEVHTLDPADQKQFIQDQICSATILSNCERRLAIQLSSRDEAEGERRAAQNLSYGNIFDPTGGAQLMELEITYELPSLFTGPIIERQNNADGDFYISAKTIFRTEPF